MSTSALWDRVGSETVSAVVGRLEAGEAATVVAGSLGLSPADLIAALAAVALGTSEADAPPLVRSRPRRPALAASLSERALADLFPTADRPSRLTLAAGLLQVFDFWEESHEAAQQAGDLGAGALSAYWHGIAHRREPDPGNATYWFRRVGTHPIFEPLAHAARSFPNLPPGRGGHWDPFDFISLCGRTDPASRASARTLQRLEMALLLEASLPG